MPELAPTILHGNAMVVFDRGVLITGTSQSGKTDLCMQLLQRGHAMIADDAVILELRNDQLIASAPAATADKIAIHGRDIHSITERFGPQALAEAHPIHCHLALDASYRQSQLCDFLTHLPQIPYENIDQFEFTLQNTLEC